MKSKPERRYLSASHNRWRSRQYLGAAVLTVSLLLILLLVGLNRIVADDSAPQVTDDGGVWTLDTMYLYLVTDDDWDRHEMGNSGGGGISHNGSWTEGGETYEGKAALTFSLPQSIPADGEATITSSGNAQWTSTGMVARRYAWAAASGVGPTENCDPVPTMTEDNAQNRTVTLSVGPHSCVIKPALAPAGANEFWVTFSAQTTINNPGLVVSTVHRLEIGVSALFRFCANPNDCRAIEGVVYTVSDEEGRIPLIGAPVTLLRNGKFLKQTITQPPFGEYVLSRVPLTNSLTLSVTLRHDAVFPSTFQIKTQQRASPVVQAWTEPFSTDPTENPLVRDIVFTDKIGFNHPWINANVNGAQLDDLATIYYHTHQAWQLADSVSQPLDDQLPVDVIAYAIQNGTFRGGASTITGPGAASFINIDAANSDVTSANRPDNREWHEFGHQVMADAFGNLMPASPGDVNHGGAANNGFVNPSTTDSWVEGFAEFYSMVVARNIVGEPRPEIYILPNLEGNYLAWNDEEFAVAGLLWDLIDPEDAGDATIMEGGSYADCIDISFTNRLWSILSTDWGDAAPKSPNLTRPDYGYIFDVKHLYDILKLQNIGGTDSRGNGLSDLDELFVAHGFFVDVGANAKSYDSGEEIGRAADAARPDRRARPPKTGSYIAFDAHDASNGAPVDVQDFIITVDYAPPFEHYSYSVRASATDTPGLLYYYGPDPQYQTTTRIDAWDPAAALISTEPLEFTNATYWAQMAENPTESFMEHTFVMEDAPRLFLPLVARSGPSLAAASVRASAPARTPVPCAPGEATPTPTPTPTPTSSPGAPLVQSVTPNHAPAGVATQLTIRGENFQPGANPFIGSTALQDVNQPDTETLQGLLPSDLDAGVYDVVVINPGGETGSLPQAFTVTGGGATPTPTPLPDYEDDFSDPQSGWPSGDSSSMHYGYVNGEYQVMLKNADWQGWATAGTAMGEGSVETDVRSADAAIGAYGIIFGLNQEATTYYVFLVDNDGFYMLGRYQDGSWDFLVPWTDSEAILLDQGVNHLNVTHQGTAISIYANETLLASQEIGGPISGRVGLIVVSYDEPFDARFDNFRVFGPAAQRQNQDREGKTADAAPFDFRRSPEERPSSRIFLPVIVFR